MKKIILNAIICLALSIILFSCAPPKVEKNEDIATNETAFLVPLEGESNSGQKKFMSIEYLESPQVKVAAKRIIMPQRSQKVGRFWNEIIWIPTMKVIKVDRSPVTREWTEEKETGSSENDEVIRVESKDSIGFKVGVNITSMVKEEDAAKFLYYFSGNPLSVIMDKDIRGSVASILSKEFGSRDLKECKIAKKDIQNILEKEVNEKYTQYGITITNVGLVGGLDYENPEIQIAINNAYIAEMKVSEAIQSKLEQDQINLKNIATAKANREAAEEFAKAQEAQVRKTNLEIELIKAKNWDGALPKTILPQNSQLLYGFDK
jgi:hypothetical protein